MYKGVYGILMLALVGAAAAACTYKGRNYPEWTFWEDGHLSCTCYMQKVTCEVGSLSGWGDVHYVSFDGMKFDLDGACRYILVEHISGSKFRLEIQQIQTSPIGSVNEMFTIRFGQNRRVDLSKVNVLVVDGFVEPSLFYDDPELRCEMIDGYILVTLKSEGIWFRWDWQYKFNVYAVLALKGHLAGLCGDFNGDPSNDLTLTPSGRPTTISEWGELWRTKTDQPSRCTAGRHGHMVAPGSDPCANYTLTMNKCSSLVNNPVFSACHAKVNPSTYIADCRKEMCACGHTGSKGCICIGVSSYIEACKDAGVTIGDGWQAQHDCEGCRDLDNDKKKYQHGEEWRFGCEVRTCTNGQITNETKKCCFEDGLAYLYGQTWRTDGQIKKCEDGHIVQKSKDPNRCYIGSN